MKTRIAVFLVNLLHLLALFVELMYVPNSHNQCMHSGALQLSEVETTTIGLGLYTEVIAVLLDTLYIYTC